MTTKICPRCGNTRLVRLETHRLKHCTDCNLDIPWELSPGQKPLHGSNRSDRRDQEAPERGIPSTGEVQAVP